jgi:hypothetical protein
MTGRVRHSNTMTREIPAPLRAAAGLAAVAVDEARRLPNRLAGLPVVALGAALQASMRVQQRYAELIGRGDELLSGMREPAEQPPWARFDEDESPANGLVAAYRTDGDGWAFADEEISDLAEDGSAYDAYVAPDADAGHTGDTGDTGDGTGPEPGPGTPAGASQAPPTAALPLSGYDRLSLPQLRARLARLSAEDLHTLLEHERDTAARPAYLTMLENRLNRLRR